MRRLQSRHRARARSRSKCSWRASSKQCPQAGRRKAGKCTASAFFNHLIFGLILRSPPIVGELSLDLPENRHDRPRQARTAATAAECAPAAGAGASARTADVPAACTGATLPTSAAGAGSQASSPSTTSAWGQPNPPPRLRAGRRRRCQTAAIAGGWLNSTSFRSIRVCYEASSGSLASKLLLAHSLRITLQHRRSDPPRSIRVCY